MIWRLFRRPAAPDPWAPWWAAAEEAVATPSADAISRLERALADAPPVEDVEPQQEMIDGLRQLLELARADRLPVVESQHRVVGADVCHFMAPVTLGEPDSTPGKLFLTSRRLVVVTSGVTARPWHAVRHVSRSGRRLAVGSSEAALVIQCNSYGEAIAACHVASRLSRGGQS